MDFIQTSNKHVDKFGAGMHGFSPGNPSGGVMATFLSNEFCDDVMMEIINVLLAGGVAPAPNVRNQLLLALRAAGVFQTAAQFDNSTKAATTAFLKARGNQGSGSTTVTTTGTLGLATLGGTVLMNSASAHTQTMPAANAVPDGAEIEFFNMNAGPGTVQRAGGDVIRVNAGTVTAITLGGGDTLRLRSNGVDTWVAVGGSAQLQYSDKYAASLGASFGTSGYQKLPSGLILQWGQATSVGGLATFTYPVTYTQTVYAVTASQGSGNFLASFTFAPALSNVAAAPYNAGTAVVTNGIPLHFFVIGK